MPVTIEFPLRTLEIRPWPDAVIDEVGFDPRSPYVERYWLGILGPSATWLVRRLAAGLEAEPAGFALDLTDAALALGLGMRGGRNAPFMRTIDRICQFGAAQRIGDDTLRVRRKLPPLTRVQLSRLPESLQADHDQWAGRAAQGGSTALAVEQMKQRARRLALSLLELGEDLEAAERQLHRWKFHPAVAREATAWALNRHKAAEAAAAEASTPAEPESA